MSVLNVVWHHCRGQSYNECLDCANLFLIKPFFDSGVPLYCEQGSAVVIKGEVVVPSLDGAFTVIHVVVDVIHEELLSAVVDVPIGGVDQIYHVC